MQPSGSGWARAKDAVMSGTMANRLESVNVGVGAGRRRSFQASQHGRSASSLREEYAGFYAAIETAPADRTDKQANDIANKLQQSNEYFQTITPNTRVKLCKHVSLRQLNDRDDLFKKGAVNDEDACFVCVVHKGRIGLFKGRKVEMMSEAGSYFGGGAIKEFNQAGKAQRLLTATAMCYSEVLTVPGRIWLELVDGKHRQQSGQTPQSSGSLGSAALSTPRKRYCSSAYNLTPSSNHNAFRFLSACYSVPSWPPANDAAMGSVPPVKCHTCALALSPRFVLITKEDLLSGEAVTIEIEKQEECAIIFKGRRVSTTFVEERNSLIGRETVRNQNVKLKFVEERIDGNVVLSLENGLELTVRNPSVQFVAVGMSDNEGVAIYDVLSGEKALNLAPPKGSASSESQSSSESSVTSCSFSDSQLLAFGVGDQVLLFDLRGTDQKPLKIICCDPGQRTLCVFRNNLLVVASAAGVIEIFDGGKGWEGAAPAMIDKVAALKTKHGMGSIGCLTSSSNHVAFGDDKNRQLVVWNLDYESPAGLPRRLSLVELFTESNTSSESGVQPATDKGGSQTFSHECCVTAAKWSPDNKLLVSGDALGSITVRSCFNGGLPLLVQSWPIVQKLRCSNGSPTGLAFTSDSSLLGVASGDRMGGRVEIWSLPSWTGIQEVLLKEKATSLVFLENLVMLVGSFDENRAIHAQVLPQGNEKLYEISLNEEFQADVVALSFSPAGKDIACISRQTDRRSSTLIILNVATGLTRARESFDCNCEVCQFFELSEDVTLLACGLKREHGEDVASCLVLFQTSLHNDGSFNKLTKIDTSSLDITDSCNDLRIVAAPGQPGKAILLVDQSDIIMIFSVQCMHSQVRAVPAEMSCPVRISLLQELSGSSVCLSDAIDKIAFRDQNFLKLQTINFQGRQQKDKNPVAKSDAHVIYEYENWSEEDSKKVALAFCEQAFIDSKQEQSVERQYLVSAEGKNIVAFATAGKNAAKYCSVFSGSTICSMGVSRLQFSNDNRYLACAGRDGKLTLRRPVWTQDVDQPKLSLNTFHVFDDHGMWGCCVAFDRHTQLLAIGSDSVMAMRNLTFVEECGRSVSELKQLIDVSRRESNNRRTEEEIEAARNSACELIEMHPRVLCSRFSDEGLMEPDESTILQFAIREQLYDFITAVCKKSPSACLSEIKGRPPQERYALQTALSENDRKAVRIILEAALHSTVELSVLHGVSMLIPDILKQTDCRDLVPWFLSKFQARLTMFQDVERADIDSSVFTGSSSFTSENLWTDSRKTGHVISKTTEAESEDVELLQININNHNNHLVVSQITGPPMLMSRHILESLLAYSDLKSLNSNDALFSTPALKSALTVAWESHVLPEIWGRFKEYLIFLIAWLCFSLCAGQRDRYAIGLIVVFVFLVVCMRDLQVHQGFSLATGYFQRCCDTLRHPGRHFSDLLWLPVPLLSLFLVVCHTFDVWSNFVRILCAVNCLLCAFRCYYFFRCFEDTASLVAILASIVKDMFAFTTILVSTLIGFAFALYVLFHDSEATDHFRTLSSSLWCTYSIALFGQTYLVHDLLEDEGEFWGFSHLLFILLQVWVLLVMMNAIIAVMADSYKRVKANEKEAMLKERASLIQTHMQGLCRTHDKCLLSQQAGTSMQADACPLLAMEQELMWIHELVPRASVEDNTQYEDEVG